MSEKTMFNEAMVKIRTAFDLLDDADNELRTLGINPCQLEFQRCNDDHAKVLLMNGLTSVSVLSEIPVAHSKPHDDYGQVIVDGISFIQQKLPVERQDRYA